MLLTSHGKNIHLNQPLHNLIGLEPIFDFMQETGLNVSDPFKAGFRPSALDLARFGQLKLNRGKWNGLQLIPEKWIDRITDDFINSGFVEIPSNNYRFHSRGDCARQVPLPGTELLSVADY